MSQQGNVYVNCPTIVAAVASVTSLHGRWFAAYRLHLSQCYGSLKSCNEWGFRSRIGQHPYAEPCLDLDVPIATLSFGETRKLIFKSRLFTTKVMQLENGSLMLMKKPNQQYYTHGIPPQSKLTKPRIILTFRSMITESNKRNSTEDDTPSKKKFKSSLPATWFHLGDGVKLGIQLFRGELAVHIRKYKTENYTEFPTGEGITISTETWFYLGRKLLQTNCMYKKEFIRGQQPNCGSRH